MKKTSIDPHKSLPLTEATYYILVALHQPRHGYAIMQYVDELSQGRVKLGAGTLYTAISKLTAQGFILPVESEGAEERRKSYLLSEPGKTLVMLEFDRLEALVGQTRPIVEQLP